MVKRFLSQNQRRDQKEETNMKHLTYDDENESDNVDKNDVVWMTTCCSEKESQIKNVSSLDPQK